MESFSTQYDVLKTSYHIQKGEYTIDEMTSTIIQAKDNIKKGKVHNAHFIAPKSIAKWGNRTQPNDNKGKPNFEGKKKSLTWMHITMDLKALGNYKYYKKFGHKRQNAITLTSGLRRRNKVFF